MKRDQEQLRALHKEGLTLLRSNRLEEAKSLYTRIGDLDPEDADAWYKLGTIHGMLGNIDEAGNCCRKVIAFQPEHSEAHATLGNVLFNRGAHAEAIAHYQTAVRINPGNAPVYNNLGNALKLSGRLDEAMESYERAIAANPSYAVAHFNLGIALQEAGRLQQAGDCFRRAVALNGKYAEAYNNLGMVLKAQNHLEEAKATLQQALAIKPQYAEAMYNLANIDLALGQLENAIEHYRQALGIKPDYADAYNNLGTALKEQGHVKLAMENYRQAIAVNPHHAGAYNNLAILFRDQGEASAADEMARRALQIRPDFADAYNTLGNIRSWQGKPDAAVEMFEKALELAPDHVSAHSNLVMMMQYLPRYSADDLLAAAQDWNARHARSLPRLAPPTNSPDPQRRLRIAYVSADFHNHPVGFFFEAVLDQHDKTEHEIFCYYNGNHHDALTARLQQSADHWRIIKGQTDQAVAERIRQDGIDILIDLSGHTQGHRLLVFPRRPAPIQLSWMGYFATTGVDGMDYIIADRFVIPPAEERFYTEQVERLPHGYLCFTPPELPIAVGPLPAHAQDRITFGCFNNPAKITPDVIACWSRLLHALPNARLHLKYKFFAESEAVQYFQNAFTTHSIDTQRIRFTGQSPRPEYLESYNGIDIALDPFPFNGCTTSVEALWMGVPVITLSSDRFAGHMGETIMKNLDLYECVADSPDDYLEKAVALAADLPRLADLRSRLRERLLNSPLCDGPGFTRDLETLYRKLWMNWCKTQRAARA
jgi:predicted O-linked N-acetylglucosamine transferase (SPINDLY family)